MKKIMLFAILLLAIDVHAGTSAIVIAYDTGNIPVNNTIDVDAEFVAMSVSLSSDAKYPTERATLIRTLQSTISTAASKSPDIDFQQSAISLSPREKSSFSLSKSYSRNSGSNFYLLVKISADQDMYSAAKDIYAFIKRIKKPEDTRLHLGNTSLAISSPNQYRTQLLSQIRKEIDNAKKILGTNYKAVISGLESPVIVRQKNDRQVTVFVDYQVTYNEKI